MYSKIIQKRARGIARSEREMANDPGVLGVIAMHRVGAYLRMQVLEKGNQSQEALLLPELWEPVCLGWGGDTMAWRGWQCAGPAGAKGQPVYLQEWRVTLIGNASREDRAASPWSPVE